MRESYSAVRRASQTQRKTIGSRARKLVSTAERRNELVLSQLDTAIKVGRQLLKRWNFRMALNEIQSIVSLALCEAAHNFREGQGAAFSTYAFYYVKGALIRSIACEKKLSLAKTSAHPLSEDTDFPISGCPYLEENSSEQAPDMVLYAGQIHEHCRQAVHALNNLEQEVVSRVYLYGTKLAVAARELGYSRGYINEVRGKAIGKLRSSLDCLGADFKMAA